MKYMPLSKKIFLFSIVMISILFLLPGALYSQRKPVVSIVFPFDVNEAYGARSFDVSIDVSPQIKKRVLLYSIFVGEEMVDYSRWHHVKRSSFTIQNLKNGNYYVGARCKYAVMQNGKKVYKWTEPCIQEIKILIPLEPSPVEKYVEHVINKFTVKVFFISLGFVIVILVIVFNSSGDKVVYYIRYVFNKIGSIFH